jgi:hypothetical protein
MEETEVSRCVGAPKRVQQTGIRGVQQEGQRKNSRQDREKSLRHRSVSTCRQSRPPRCAPFSKGNQPKAAFRRIDMPGVEGLA